MFIVFALGIAIICAIAWFWLGVGKRGREVEMIGHEGAEVAGRFIRGQRVGRGSLGLVYEAWDKQLERHIALKKLHDFLLQNPADAARFVEHAKAAALLKHPGIVELYDVFNEQSGVYFISAFVKGKTLHQLIGQKGRLKVQETLEVIKPVAQALAFAHKNQIVHGGLKPLNIVISNGGMLVMDFGMPWGIANAVSNRAGSSQMGVYPYQPPEQEAGILSGAVDFYALGVCAYQMLTGELPFSGPEMRALKLEGKFLSPEEIEPDLPGILDLFFRKAFAPSPDMRFKTAEEFLAAFKPQ